MDDVYIFMIEIFYCAVHERGTMRFNFLIQLRNKIQRLSIKISCEKVTINRII